MYKIAHIHPEITFKFDPNHRFVFLGSCFSENIGNKFKSLNINTLIHPNGTVFHPEPIARFIQNALKNEEPIESSIVQREDLFFSFDTSSSCYAFSKEDVIKSVKEKQVQLNEQLKTANWLFLTFGSAHGYRIKQNGLIAANCHKLNPKLFEKELSPSDEIVNSWNETINLIRLNNPTLQIVFTISPVRYLRDGWIENNRSKARLIEAVHSLIEKNQNCYYLPVYEWVIDDLRDKAYYEIDLTHPNQRAVECVWERMVEQLGSANFKSFYELMRQYQSMEAHRIQFPNSLEAKRFEENKMKKRAEISARFPNQLTD